MLMKLFVPLSFLFASSLNAQNIADNKVSFDYVQLPTNPVSSQYTSYSLVINKLFEKSNQDSLNLHQARVDAAQVNFDAQYNVWRDQKKAIDRQYLATLASWEKNNLTTGISSPKPERPPYPAQPLKEDVRDPRLHDDITSQYSGSLVRLEGFTAGEGGATVTLDIQPISGITITKKTNGTGATTKFEYSCNYSLPVNIKVECPSKGIVFNTVIGTNVKSYPLNSFATTYDYEIWMMDNYDKFWMDLQSKARADALAEVNTVLNENCGYPVKRRVTEVFSVKSHREFTYADLTTAYTTAEQGYRLIVQNRDHTAAAQKLLEAIANWDAVLKESNVTDKKSRVNDEVTALLHYNIAEAYGWLSQFDEAEKYINLCIADGVMKFKGMAKDLDVFLDAQKVRWNANF